MAKYEFVRVEVSIPLNRVILHELTVAEIAAKLGKVEGFNPLKSGHTS